MGHIIGNAMLRLGASVQAAAAIPQMQPAQDCPGQPASWHCPALPILLTLAQQVDQRAVLPAVGGSQHGIDCWRRLLVQSELAGSKR